MPTQLSDVQRALSKLPPEALDRISTAIDEEIGKLEADAQETLTPGQLATCRALGVTPTSVVATMRAEARKTATLNAQFAENLGRGITALGGR